MFYFYVLYSLKDGKLYKGYSTNIGERFLKHQAGGTRSTRHRRPLILLYVEAFNTKSEAMARERWSKSIEGGTALRQILVGKQILAPAGELWRGS